MWHRVLVIVVIALIGFGVQTASAQTEYQEFVSIDPPCRMVDTREATYPSGYGPPHLTAGLIRNYQMTGSPPSQLCTIPAGARAVAVNLTVTAGGGISLLQGHLTAFPTNPGGGGPVPLISNVNWDAGVLAEANSAIVPLNATGNMSVQSIVNTHFVMDVFGYFLDAEELAENLAGGSFALGGDKPGSPNIGVANVALGFQAIENINGGNQNVAVGAHSIGNGSLSGANNIGVGYQTLLELATGSGNIAIGSFALDALVSGNNNIAIGLNALTNLGPAGNDNIALGPNAGTNLQTGSNNIYIGHPGGGANQSNTVIIGNDQIQTLRLVSLNVELSALASALPLPVLAGLNGILSLGVSTARAKEDIQDMGDATEKLMKLRPVTFRYKPERNLGPSLQYGLIAEEVAEVYPELVARDAAGQPLGIAYQELPAMLLNEIQRQHRQIEGQEAKIAAQQSDIAELRARLLRLEDAKVTAHQTAR
jgi:hypothetical protein